MAENNQNKGLDVKTALQNIFLAGVGAAATVGEKASSIADDLVKKGQLTVEQGHALNEELQKRAHSAVNHETQEAIRTHLEHMDSEQRKEFVKSVRKMANEIEREAANADETQKS